MTYVGIDYGFGKTNIDPNTMIRYGIIPAHSLDSWVYEELEPDYGKPHCPNCGDPIRESVEFMNDNADRDYYCSECDQSFWSEECFPDSPLCHVLDKDGYIGEMDEMGDIFLVRSKYYTLAQFCSPCAPGAGYILNHTPEGVKTYCFNHDWFEEGKTPYPVYSVETGELVTP